MPSIVNLNLEEQCAEVCTWCADWSERRATVRERQTESPWDVIPNGRFYHYADGFMVRYCEASPIRQKAERDHLFCS